MIHAQYWWISSHGASQHSMHWLDVIPLAISLLNLQHWTKAIHITLFLIHNFNSWQLIEAWCIGGGRWFWVWRQRELHEWHSCCNGTLQEVYIRNYIARSYKFCDGHLLCSIIYIYHLSCCEARGEFHWLFVKLMKFKTVFISTWDEVNI